MTETKTEPSPAPALEFHDYETMHPATMQFAPWVPGVSTEGISTKGLGRELREGDFIALHPSGKIWAVEARELEGWQRVDREPRFAAIVGDLQPIQDIRATLLRLHAELRPLDPGGAFATRNDRVVRLGVDLNHVEGLVDVLDMAGGLIALLRSKVDAEAVRTEGFATPGTAPHPFDVAAAVREREARTAAPRLGMPVPNLQVHNGTEHPLAFQVLVTGSVSADLSVDIYVDPADELRCGFAPTTHWWMRSGVCFARAFTARLRFRFGRPGLARFRSFGSKATAPSARPT